MTRGRRATSKSAKVRLFASFVFRVGTEREEFVERTIRQATLHDLAATACSCANRYVCRHNRTASYKLRKRNPLVIRYRNAARKLRKSKRPAEAMEFEEKAMDLDRREAIAWTKRVQQSALKTKLPLMIKAQEAVAEAVKSKQSFEVSNLKISHRRAVDNLRRVLECERAKALVKMINHQKNAMKIEVDESGEHLASSRAATEGDQNLVPTGAISANIKEAMLRAQLEAEGGGGGVSDDELDLEDFGIAADDDDVKPSKPKKKTRFADEWENPDESGLQNSAPVFRAVLPDGTVAYRQSRGSRDDAPPPKAAAAPAYGLGNSAAVFSLA